MDSPFVVDYLGEGTAWVPPQKLTFTSEAPITSTDAETEDCGQAKILAITFKDPELFMRLHSWSDVPHQHNSFDSFLQMAEGKRIKITFEVL